MDSTFHFYTTLYYFGCDGALKINNLLDLSHILNIYINWALFRNMLLAPYAVSRKSPTLKPLSPTLMTIATDAGHLSYYFVYLSLNFCYFIWDTSFLFEFLDLVFYLFD